MNGRPACKRILAVTALLCVTAAVHARGIAYGAVTQAALIACDEQYWSGKLDAARGCYRKLVNDADPAVRAEAAWALGDFKSANQWFGEASKRTPKNAPLLTRWGELYVDTHQDQEAFKLFREALQADSKYAYAQVGAAELLIDQFDSEANEYLKPVLEGAQAPAGARLRALLLAARVVLENSDLKSGADLLNQATQLATQARLPQLEIFALKAALDLLNNKAESEWTAKALADNPAYGDAHAIPAHFYEITRRTRPAVELYRKAVEIQPDHWAARVELGSNLLRDNRITEARQQLEAAYQGDPYNPITVNLLRLLDTLKDFDVLTYPEQAGVRSASQQQPIVLRMDKKEAQVLAPYARRLAEQSIAAYTERYDFKLQEPVIIEIYPNHDDFAVRTAGVPGIGLLGVTFGYLFAMDSPTSRPVNEFHWGTTLWHEMAHVFTLSATEQKVPRWFSEGVSVFEEWNTGPVKGVMIPGYVFEAFKAGKALPVAELDRGFIHPEYPQQVQVSYMQAGLTCEFIQQQFGFDKLVALLQQFKRDNNTATAVEKVFGIAPKEFDAQFGAFIEARYGKLLAQLDGWRKARATAASAANKGNWNEALEAANKALELLAEDVEDGSPYLPLAQAHDKLGKPAEALKTLETYWKKGGHEPAALKSLAQRLYAQNRKADALAVMQSVNYVAPFDYALHGEFGDWLLEANRAEEALSEYQVAMALSPPDRAMGHYRLATAQRALQRDAEAKRNLLAALEIAPNYRPAQQMLLEMSRAN